MFPITGYSLAINLHNTTHTQTDRHHNVLPYTLLCSRDYLTKWIFHDHIFMKLTRLLLEVLKVVGNRNYIFTNVFVLFVKFVSHEHKIIAILTTTDGLHALQLRLKDSRVAKSSGDRLKSNT